jgi:DNA-binding CsgD family transcriptional regulator/PAS domain-containing protein
MAHLDEADLLNIVDDIYEASLDRSRWGAVLNRLCSLYDGKAILFQQDLVRGASDVVEFCGFEPSYVQSYAEHYGVLNPCLESRAHLLVGAVATDDMLVERAVAERSEFYNDWLCPQELGAAVGAVLEKGTDVSVNIAVLRAARRGTITPAEHVFFERVAPHLRRALRLDRELAATRMGRDLAIDALDRFGNAALVADGEGRVLYANQRAEAHLRAPAAAGGLGFRFGRLCGPTAADTLALTAAVRACVLNGTGRSAAPPPATLHLARVDATPLSVLVLPFCGDRPLGFGLPTALLLVHAPEDMPSFDATRLARFYGLTLACGRLLAGLVSGQSLAGYAEANGVSLNTVKTHLKKIFVDTGQTRQSDLMRLVLSNPVAVAAARAD